MKLGFLLLTAAAVAAGQRLPVLHDGSVVAGPGQFHHDGPLSIEGHITLRHLTLDLRGPISVAPGATFELDDVHLNVSDPPGAQNGASGLKCEGPAHLIVRASTMQPSGSAHPMWLLKGDVEIDNFQSENSEFHFDHVDAHLKQFRIFELEVSRNSRVVANRLSLVFFSTHTGDDDRINITDIPAGRPFSRKLALGSGATADLTDATVQLFLVYLHGRSEVTLSHMGRVQLAMFPQCKGNLRLPNGRVASDSAPAVVPAPGSSDCPFKFTLNDVNVDTWDVYAGANADLALTDSRIDELTANGHAKLTVRHSDVYADWLSLAEDSELLVEDSTVGSLRLASERPDLATSQIRLAGRSRSIFRRVRFDCGLIASDDARAEIDHAVIPPKYARTTGRAVVSGISLQRP